MGELLKLDNIKDVVTILAYGVAIIGGIYSFFKWGWPKISPLIYNYFYLHSTGINVIRDIEAHFGKEAGKVLRDVIREKGLEIVIDEMRLNIIENTIGLGIFISDATGKCTYANKTLAKMFGRSQHDMLGYGWLSPIVDKQTAYNNWRFSIDNITPYRDTYSINSDNGVTIMYAEAEPSMDEEGNVILGYVGIVKPKPM